jgi:cystathionine gamma-lyase
MNDKGPSTRAIHAGLPDAAQGEPLLPGPVLAAPYHLRGAADSAPYAYGRDENPTWTHLERAIGELDGGEAVVFASGMAAVSAVVLPRLRPGDVLVAPHDAYPGIRKLASEQLEPGGVEVRFVPTATEAIVEATAGAALVWVETPSNPALDVADLDAIAAATSAEGALLAVDNTVATPLGQRPLDHGADFAMVSGTKSLTGHGDVLLGAVSVRDPALAAELRTWRSRTGAILGPFEAWIAHRSLATLGLRLERSQANARAVADALAARDDVSGVRWPGVGAVVAMVLSSAGHAEAFLDACTLVSQATSFGGVHSTAERRARWGTDDVPEGFIRFSAGCEDTADLVADVVRALDSVRGR